MHNYNATHREQHTARSHQWVKENREKRRAIQRRYRETHKAQITALFHARRVAVQHEGSATAADIAEILARTQGRCIYCGKERPLTLDHFTPLRDGGTNEKVNLLPCCRSCNSSKNAKEGSEWLHNAHGIVGLGRALLFIERNPIPEQLWT